MQWLLKKIIGTKTQRDLKKLWPIVQQVNTLEQGYQTLTAEQLRDKTAEFKKRIADGATLDSLMPEAFAVVKNACRRLCGTTVNVCGHDLAWDMVPYDVQIIGGIVLHQGKIAEMATGEGKTLVSTFPVYLNALTGRGVHVVTVNDYLAKRDAEWMGHVHRFLGLSVGCIQNAMRPAQRREQYAFDITYGTNSEFGFDYLRDMGMAYRAEDMVQRGHAFAIVDEIDSILIDEARTPLIISGPAQHSSVEQFRELRPAVERLVRKQRDLCNELMSKAKTLLEKGENWEAQLALYQVRQGMPKHNQLMKMLEEPSSRKLLEQVENHMLIKENADQARAMRENLYFAIDEKGRDASLTDKGCAAMNPSDPDMYVMPDLVSGLADLDADASIPEEERFRRRQKLQEDFARKSEIIHAVDQLIRAYCVYEKDVEYVVQDGQVVIVDEYTGRLMPGRRWSDGLHQAVESKEGVAIERETQTLATITIQNYFRMYGKLAGMTGTAETEADEFFQIYKLDVVVIPTNRPIRRVDSNDMIYKTQREKFKSVLDEIAAAHERKQPVLVGTVSVESSELLSKMLNRRGIPHNVLNAKNHQREAEIVSRAGQPGAVTIATNMAGRGTDIKLGEGVVKVDREAITSQMALDDRYKDTTLKKFLLQNPCGLYVIGTERHESRRIDRQLRGRCARQGDPGTSRFYISLEDDLMRLFGSDRISRIMEKLGIEEGEVLEHPLLNRSMETAQRRVEQQNFSIRKRTLEYDDVMNKQREVVYELRSSVVASENVRHKLFEVVEEAIRTKVDEAVELKDEEARTILSTWVDSTFPIGMKPDEFDLEKEASELSDLILDRVRKAYDVKAQFEDPNGLAMVERIILLQAIDTHWQEFLRSMDALRQGVGLRAYAQTDPLVEFKKEAFRMFSDLLDQIHVDVAHKMFRSATSAGAFQSFLTSMSRNYVHDQVQALGGKPSPQASAGVDQQRRAPPGAEEAMQKGMEKKSVPIQRQDNKTGRNDPCPCGSGKKYKKCCGAGLG